MGAANTYANGLCDCGGIVSKQDRCPCGGIILADTENWHVPLCYECYCSLSKASEPWAGDTEQKIDDNYYLVLKLQRQIDELRAELSEMKKREQWRIEANDGYI